MLKPIENFLRVNVRKPQYRHLFLLYTLYTVVALTISSLILMNYFNGVVSREVEKNNSNFLAYTRTVSDNILQNKIQYIIYHYFLDNYKDQTISDFFANDPQADMDTQSIYAAYNALSGMVTNSDQIIHSVYLYRSSNDILVSSREGIIFHYSDNQYDRQFVNDETVRRIMESPKSYLWFTPLDNSVFLAGKSEWDGYSIITLAYRIPYLSSDKLGCVVININEDIFLKRLMSANQLDYGEFIVIDAEGKVISRSNRNELLAGSVDEAYLADVMRADNGSSIVKTKTGQLFIQWVKSSVTELKYVIETPVATINQPIYIARQFSLAVCFSILIFSLLCLQFINKRLYKPIHHLVNAVAAITGAKVERENELLFVENTVNHLSTEITDMRQTIDNNRELIKHKVIIDLIMGNYFPDPGQILERFRVAGVTLQNPYFALVITELDKKELERLTPEQAEYVLLSIVSIIDGYFDPQLTGISISLKTNCIVTFLNFAEGQYDTLVADSLSRITQNLPGSTGIPCNIALSAQTDRIQQIHALYGQAESYLKYSFIHGYRNIFCQKSIQAYESGSQSGYLPAQADLAGLLRAGKADGAAEGIRKACDIIRNRQLSYGWVQSYLKQLIESFYALFREQDLLDALPEYSHIMQEFAGYNSLDEFAQGIEKLMQVYLDSAAQRDNFINYKYIDRIKEYIVQHIEDQISLNSIADEFRISPSYLSKMFKRFTGVNFLDFVLDHKFEKAKEMLLSDHKRSIAKIAEVLGYYHLPYFISVFRKKYGMSPTQYRKNYLRHEN